MFENLELNYTHLILLVVVVCALWYMFGYGSCLSWIVPGRRARASPEEADDESMMEESDEELVNTEMTDENYKRYMAGHM